MIGLEDGMLLYHGSYVSISNIDLSRCMGGLDFGRGFYLTSSYEQAYNYVQLSVRKAKHIGAVPKNFAPADCYQVLLPDVHDGRCRSVRQQLPEAYASRFLR